LPLLDLSVVLQEPPLGAILIISDEHARECGGSELFFHLVKLCERPSRVVVPTEFKWSLTTRLLIRVWRRNRLVRFIKNRSNTVSRLYTILVYRILQPRLEAELSRAYRDTKIAGIWTIAHDFLPSLALSLARRFCCPLHVSVFDIPYTFGFPDDENSLLKRCFPDWAREAFSLDFASPGMKEYFAPYREGTAERDTVIWSSAGISPAPTRPPQVRSSIESIVFCGALRFFHEMRALSKALVLLERRYGKRIALKLYASKSLDMPACEYMGFLTNRADLTTALRSCDLAYSPLSFDPKDRLLVETSFPGKIASYLQADIPIIAHAPATASNHRFVVENEVGIGIDSLDPELIATRILQYESTPELRQSHARNCQRALGKWFDPGARAGYFSDPFAPVNCSSLVKCR